MGKDIATTVAYWHDPGTGAPPDPTHDAELFLGHADEELHPATIHDIRGAESQYTLDGNGFMACTLPVRDDRCTVENADAARQSADFAELSELVKRLTGAKHALPFLPVIRAVPRNAHPARQTGGKRFTGPSPRPHVDVSAATAKPWAISKFHGFFGPGQSGTSATLADAAVAAATDAASEKVDVAALIEGSSRWQVLGLWRPIKPIRRDPLILTDTPSVPESDFFDVSRDHTFGPGSDWEVTILRTAREGMEEHRWCWWSDMQPNEVFVFKHYDSRERDVKAWRCAHTSVEIEGTAELPPRESYEVRMLVFY